MLLTKPKKINNLFIDNFNIDLKFLDSFSKQLKDVDVADCFIELKQTIELIKNENYDDFFNVNVCAVKYSRVRSHVLVCLLDKLKMDAGYFGKSSVGDKTRLKKIEDFIKKIKQ